MFEITLNQHIRSDRLNKMRGPCKGPPPLMTILLKQQYSLVLMASCLTFLSALYGIHQGYYHLAIVPACVCLTSVIYWFYPDESWRLSLDLIVVRSMIAYHHVMSLNSEHAILYYTLAITMFFIYVAGQIYYSKGDNWSYVICHLMVYVTGNMGNAILYSGAIETPWLLTAYATADRHSNDGRPQARI